MAIRPAIDTLRELPENTLDKLAMEIRNVMDSVTALSRKGKVTLTIHIEPMSKNRLVDAPLAFRADVIAKPPLPEPEATIFFADEHGNPTRQPQARQNDLGLVAAHLEKQA
jgi:hypothetical protein